MLLCYIYDFLPELNWGHTPQINCSVPGTIQKPCQSISIDAFLNYSADIIKIKYYLLL